MFRFLKKSGPIFRRHSTFHHIKPQNSKVELEGETTGPFKSSRQLEEVSKSKFTAFRSITPSRYSTFNSRNSAFDRPFRGREKAKGQEEPESPRPEQENGNEDCEFSPIPSRLTGRDRYNFIYKPIAFTVLVGGAGILGCNIWKRYEEYCNQLPEKRILASDLARIEDEPLDMKAKIKAWWNSLSPGRKLFWPICAINGLVFMAFKIPPFSSTMRRYFMCAPMKGALPTMLSVFSHQQLWHICANMLALHFSLRDAEIFMKKEEILALYLTSGVISSLGSRLFRLLIKVNVPSLGASGAIFGLIGLVCTALPDVENDFGLKYTNATLLKVLLAIDATVLLFVGMKRVDHVAHLVGAFIGIVTGKVYEKLGNLDEETLEHVLHDLYPEIRGREMRLRQLHEDIYEDEEDNEAYLI